MKQYFAITGRTQAMVLLYGRYKHALVSYYYYKGTFRDIIQRRMLEFDSFVMDSGAFSAFNNGKEIDLDDYERTLKDDGIEKYFSLDAIGDAGRSYDNYMELRSRGLDPIPTFHINTDIEYLYKYLDETDHISIGGMVGGQFTDENLLKIWHAILTRNPEAKIHGLGVSNYQVAIKYPWHSIDSSTWCSITKFARTNIWNKRQGSFIAQNTVEEFLPSLNIIPENGSLKGLTELLWLFQMENYNQMIDSANEYQSEKDFSHLTSQTKLF